MEPSSEATALGSAPSLPPTNHLSGPYLLSSVPHTLRGPGQSQSLGVFSSPGPRSHLALSRAQISRGSSRLWLLGGESVSFSLRVRT